MIEFNPLCDDDENLLFAKLTKGALKALEGNVIQRKKSSSTRKRQNASIEESWKLQLAAKILVR